MRPPQDARLTVGEIATIVIVLLAAALVGSGWRIINL